MQAPSSGIPAPARPEVNQGSRWARIRSVRNQRWWPWFKRAVTLAFFGLVAWLIIKQGRTIDWSQVVESMRQRSRGVLALAALLAASSHLLYSCFDLFGRRVTGHRLPKLRVMAITFVSYIFNLNLGSLIGGMAFRYRLYSGQGLDAQTITTIVATSMLTNWLGYLLIGGLVLVIAPPALPPDWPVTGAPLRLAGAGMLAVALAWQLSCMLSRRREWQVGSTTITLPSTRMAALQLLASSSNWAIMAGVIYVLFEQRIDYPLALATLLVAAVAGVITHVPAGLGVLEAVFVAMIGTKLPHAEVIGTLLLYRALYYLAPLGLAILMQWRVESTAKRVSNAPAAGEQRT